MEEIVRAFNFVIDQGWVRLFLPLAFSNRLACHGYGLAKLATPPPPAGVLLGDV